MPLLPMLLASIVGFMHRTYDTAWISRRREIKCSLGPVLTEILSFYLNTARGHALPYFSKHFTIAARPRHGHGDDTISTSAATSASRK